MTDQEIKVARESMETYIGFANALKNNPKARTFYIAAATAINDFLARVGAGDFIYDLTVKIPRERLHCIDCRYAEVYRRGTGDEVDDLGNETDEYFAVCRCEGSPFYNQEDVNPVSCNDFEETNQSLSERTICI